MEAGITPEMERALLEAARRENEFWDRHGLPQEKETRLTGQASDAHRSWVQAVEKEYDSTKSDSRAMLDTPIARKAFILGFNYGRKQK